MAWKVSPLDLSTGRVGIRGDECWVTFTVDCQSDSNCREYLVNVRIQSTDANEATRKTEVQEVTVQSRAVVQFVEEALALSDFPFNSSSLPCAPLIKFFAFK